jgi:hypothetical protein
LAAVKPVYLRKPILVLVPPQYLIALQVNGQWQVQTATNDVVQIDLNRQSNPLTIAVICATPTANSIMVSRSTKEVIKASFANLTGARQLECPYVTPGITPQTPELVDLNVTVTGLSGSKIAKVEPIGLTLTATKSSSTAKILKNYSYEYTVKYFDNEQATTPTHLERRAFSASNVSSIQFTLSSATLLLKTNTTLTTLVQPDETLGWGTYFYRLNGAYSGYGTVLATEASKSSLTTIPVVSMPTDALQNGEIHLLTIGASKNNSVPETTESRGIQYAFRTLNTKSFQLPVCTFIGERWGGLIYGGATSSSTAPNRSSSFYGVQISTGITRYFSISSLGLPIEKSSLEQLIALPQWNTNWNFDSSPIAIGSMHYASTEALNLTNSYTSTLIDGATSSTCYKYSQLL